MKYIYNLVPENETTTCVPIPTKLKNDENYYGKFGNQYLSNSDIKALLTNPLDFKKPSTPNPAFVVGGYFHTCILEPDKLEKYKVAVRSIPALHEVVANKKKMIDKLRNSVKSVHIIDIIFFFI